ncbi:MAG: dockerin type I domain-containing protein, partial [Aureliella sp.]
IPLSSSAQTIEIRAIDARTGVTSNVFQGRLGRADAVTQPGIDGFVWTDTNHNDVRDAGEFGEAGWTVEVLSAAGEALGLRRIVEPDALPDGALLAGATPGAKITAFGADTDGRVGVTTGTSSGSSTKLFGAYSRASQSWSADWTTASRRMLVEFATPTSVVEIDAIGTSSGSYGRIEAYDAAGKLLDRFTTSKLSDGQVATMRVESSVGAIASVKISGHANTSVRLDNLRFGAETKVTTGEKGQFSVPGLPSGTYLVKVTPAGGQNMLGGTGGSQQLTTVTAGNVTNDVDFAFQVANNSPWTNPTDPLDVNDDHLVSALDVLLIVNDINQHGPHALVAPDSPPRPFVDVTGDVFLSALDALRVVNFINGQGAGDGEGASVSAASVAPARANVLPADAGALACEAVPAGEIAGDQPAAAVLPHDEALLAMPDEFDALALEWQAFSGSVPDRRSTDSAS